MIVRVLSVLLGAVFLVAGIGKMPVMATFAATVASVAQVSPAPAYVLAWGVVSLEILGALALLANVRVQSVSLAFCVLVAGFVWILTAAIFQGKEIPCNCFGVAGIHLSNLQELMLDLMLFNGFAVLAHASRLKVFASGGKDKRGRILSVPVIVTAVLLLEVSLAFSVIAGGSRIRSFHHELAIEFGERSNSRFAMRQSGARALLLMKFSDLNCPLCFDDFMALTDSLKAALEGNERHRVAALFNQDGFIHADSTSHLRRWCAANEFPFPVVVAPDTLFAAMNVTKSTFVVVDGKNAVLSADTFPMGEVKRNGALQRLLSAGK